MAWREILATGRQGFRFHRQALVFLDIRRFARIWNYLRSDGSLFKVGITFNDQPFA